MNTTYYTPSPNASAQSTPMTASFGQKVESEPFILESHDDFSLHEKKNQKLKKYIRILRFCTRFTVTGLAAATATQEAITLSTYLTTKDTIRAGRGPWAKHTSLWPAVMLLSISGITFLLGFSILIAYIVKGVKAANSISTVQTSLSWITETVHIIIWIVVAVLYRVGKTGSDLWGWACSPVAQKIQINFEGVVKFRTVCASGRNSWQLAITSAAIQIVSFIILLMVIQRRQVQKRLAET
ncbi:hypothetical protein B0J14DRAFT_61779 [Halenospora varia]|nr:hypothetical protein B0J14DRAFT_61779 [Halenospora varia]